MGLRFEFRGRGGEMGEFVVRVGAIERALLAQEGLGVIPHHFDCSNRNKLKLSHLLNQINNQISIILSKNC